MSRSSGYYTPGIVLIWATFSNADGIYRDVDSDCSTRPDAGISGVGVRVSIWAQIGMSILISIIGFFHE
ncbi:hypothetical protein CC77DRAFT_559535 [Alternaria alternata]|uniref:Uncharacterized protein n=1 Tax=Alternaria alternata TaxID=5599 RepID=A0A177D6H8_ALTAL|nr:hypothetical protein CC77DRAFT_559535 [Alternaria alternata]OAG14549.1 hypothetical protein CC77DRAFT_559535 [Alternaria alternata]